MKKIVFIVFIALSQFSFGMQKDLKRVRLELAVSSAPNSSINSYDSGSQRNSDNIFSMNQQLYLELETFSKKDLEIVFLDSIQHCCNELVEYCLKQGCNPCCRNEKGDAAAMIALEAGSSIILKLLLDNGADLPDENRFGVDLATCCLMSKNREAITDIIVRHKKLRR